MTAAFLANLSALALSVLGIRQKEIFTAFFFLELLDFFMHCFHRSMFLKSPRRDSFHPFSF
jgi:hypothetical protein